MSDNDAEWRRKPPRGLYATVTVRRCGWHVQLYDSGSTAVEALHATRLAASCVPYKPDAEHAKRQDQVEALAVGLYNIAAEVREDCRNL
jgi:hypothetical protein